MELPERFELEPSSSWLFRMTPWAMMAFAVLCALLPLLPGNGKPRNEAFLIGFASFGFLAFCLGAWYSFKTVRRLPEAAISVDKDGLWPTVRERGIALVKWSDIAQLRERANLQRLEALDGSGKVIARLEYQLRNFQRLRSIVVQRAQLKRTFPSVYGVYQKTIWYHLVTIISMIGFVLIGVYLGQTHPFVGYASMTFVVAMIGWEYATTPFRLGVTRDALEIHWPFRRRRVPRASMTRIEIEDAVIKHAKYPHVTLQVADGAKPIPLKALGLDAVDLHQLLQAWQRGDAQPDARPAD